MATTKPVTMDEWTTWPEWATDAIVCDVDVVLSWRAAWRVLWHRRLTVTVKTWTAERPGQTASISRTWIPPWRTRRRGGAVESPVVSRG